MTVQWHLSNNMIPDSPLPSEYGDDEYGAFNCAGEQMPVHEDARNTKQRCDKRLIIGIPLGEKAHQAILAEGAANVYARLRNKSRQFGRNPPTWPLGTGIRLRMLPTLPGSCAAAVRCWLKTVRFKNVANRGVTDAVAEVR